MKIPVGRASRLASVVGIAVALLSISGACWAVLPSYTGTLNSGTAPPGLQGSGLWVTPGVSTIVWSISELGDGRWNYNYTFSVPSDNIDHFILDCSPEPVAGDLSQWVGDFTGFTIGTFTPPDPNNPNLPGALTGIEFLGVNTTASAFHFHCTHGPVWGNFYATDGSTNTAWNSRFLLPNPTDPPSSGSLSFKILVPDPASSAVPDASTIVLACFGALQLLAVRRKIIR